jgi:hypothetical protein
MSAQHTPGPWFVDEVDNEGEYGDGGPDSHRGFKSFSVIDEAGNVLFDSLNATVSDVQEHADDESGHHRAWDELAQRNLTLAAEAPELLKHLQHAVRFFDQLTKADADRYRAAIAKATGGAA